MAYSGEDLFRNYRKTYVISPFQASQVSPLGYDLRIGFAITIKYPHPDQRGTLHKEMTRPAPDPTKPDDRPLGKLIVEPGECILIVTVEQIYLSSKVLGTVQAKASHAVQGLFLNPVTVDPNFGSRQDASGRLILFMHNASGRRLTLTEKQGVATLIMHEVSTETLHLPEKTGFENVLSALSDTYEKSVIERISAYTKNYIDKRGKTEFVRDRQAVQNLRANTHQGTH
ncbi:MAG: hypothetical protein WA056_10440 [Gallionella sp.]